MLDRERNPDGGGLPPFWSAVRDKKAGADLYFNSVTNSSQAARPANVRGGIVADDMGLGKTLHVLAVVVANPAEGVRYLPQGAAGAAAEEGARAAAREAEEAAAAAEEAEAEALEGLDDLSVKARRTRRRLLLHSLALILPSPAARL